MTKWLGNVSPTSINLTRAGSGGSLVLLGVLAAAALAVVSFVAHVLAPYNDVVGTVLGAAVVLVAVGLASPLVLMLCTEVIVWPWQWAEQRRCRELRARWAAQDTRRAEQEAAAAAERDAAVAAAVDGLADEGLDGKRDGRLVDAADRFRRLGTFPVDNSSDDRAAGGA